MHVLLNVYARGRFRARDRDIGNWEYFVFEQLRQLSEDELQNTIGIGSPIWVQAAKDRRIDFSTFTQFTGLKDKNSRDVYEGDILRCTDIISGQEYVGDIQIHSGGFWMKMGPGQLLIGSEEGREVIGNIYENPELLK
jgi:uncharacterized phage protein (TIGR01671 family)